MSIISRAKSLFGDNDKDLLSGEKLFELYGRLQIPELIAAIKKYEINPELLVRRMIDTHEINFSRPLLESLRDSGKEVIFAIIDVLEPHPKLLNALLLSPGRLSKDYAFNMLITSFKNDSDAFLSRVINILAPSDEWLERAFSTEIVSHATYEDQRRHFIHVNNPEDPEELHGKTAQTPYHFLRAIRAYPAVIRNALLNSYKSSSNRFDEAMIFEDEDFKASNHKVIDCEIYWTEEGIELLKDLFKDEPQMLFEVILLSDRLFSAARTHSVERVNAVIKAYSNIPNLLTAMLNRVDDRGRGIAQIAASQVHQNLPSSLSISTLVEFIEAFDGRIPFPTEEIPRLLSCAKIIPEGHLFHHQAFFEIKPESANDQISQREKYKALLAALSPAGRTIKNIPKATDTKQFHAFAVVIEKLNLLAAKLDPRHLEISDGDYGYYISPILPDILVRTPGDWIAMRNSIATYSLEQISNIQDSFPEFAKYICIPWVQLLIGEEPASSLTNEQLGELIADANSHLSRVLCDTKSIGNILRVSERWHNRRTAIISEIRDFAEEGAWNPLLKKIHIEIDSGSLKGWQIVNLTTAGDLDREGAIMHHCVSGYTRVCLSTTFAEHSDILSFRDANGRPQSTIELKRIKIVKGAKNPDAIQIPNSETGLIVAQHRGIRDARITKEQHEVFLWLKENIEKGKIEVQLQHIGAMRNEEFNIKSPFINAIGFEPNDASVEKAWDALANRTNNALRVTRNCYLIPKKYEGYTAKRFVEETGLLEKLEDKLLCMGFRIIPPQIELTSNMEVEMTANNEQPLQVVPMEQTLAEQTPTALAQFTEQLTVNGYRVAIGPLKLKDGMPAIVLPMTLERSGVDDAEFFGAALQAPNIAIPAMWGFDLSANRHEAIQEADETFKGFLYQTGLIDTAAAIGGLAITSDLYAKAVDFDRLYKEQRGEKHKNLNQGNLRLFQELSYGFSEAARIFQESGREQAEEFWNGFVARLDRGLPMPEHLLRLAEGQVKPGEPRRLQGGQQNRAA